jgi:hypothetical protein
MFKVLELVGIVAAILVADNVKTKIYGSRFPEMPPTDDDRESDITEVTVVED